MGLLILQLAVSVLAIALVARVYQRWRKGSVPLGEAIGWWATWGIVALVFWRPQLTTAIANALGIGRGADFVVYGAILCILFLIFRLTVRLDRIERSLTAVVRRQALSDDRAPHDSP